jgi:apolipoprotein N-acyltransferase
MRPVILLSPSWRLVAGTLVFVSLATLPTYVLAIFLLPPVPPVVMVRSFVVGTALPAIMAWGIERLFGGTADVRDGALRLHRGDLDVEAPCAALAAVRPWWVALPRPGLALRTGAGRLPVGVALDDPSALLDALASAGVDVAAARRQPGVVRAATRGHRTWRGWVLDFPVLGALPASILFYTHQHIAYGGTFGQWYLEGALPYLSTYAQYWATTVILLLSYAAMWRAAAELVVWMAAAIDASWASVARRVVEIACGLAYYGGVPLMLALRYLA